MRSIGKVQSRKEANTFGGYLYLHEIENTVEEATDGQWEIWVHEDDCLEQAEEYFRAFQDAADSAEFTTAEKQAERLRKKQERTEVAARKPVVDARQVWASAEGTYPIGLVTTVLVVLSAGFYLLAEMRGGGQWPSILFIRDFQEVDGLRLWEQGGLASVRRGQVWRLVSPIFIHFTLLHLMFNMMWLMDLGGMVEYNKGSNFFTGFILLVAAASNLGQYVMAGPNFGGMSGVVYGLLGYAWIMGRYDPGSGMKLRPATVTLMLGWFFVCILFARIMPVANTAHAVGLGLGMAWGFFGSGGIDRVRRRLNI
jgi:GlpG protein